MEIYNNLESKASKEFQELLNSQLSKTKNLAEGKIIEGKITKITEKYIFLFIPGLKSEPVIDINEMKTIGMQDKIIEGEKENTHLRIDVLGGGCAGFSYNIDLDNKVNEEDIVLNKDGVKILINKAFVPYLEGSSIEFVDELIGKSFKINNPNATSSCGCGVSFSM